MLRGTAIQRALYRSLKGPLQKTSIASLMMLDSRKHGVFHLFYNSLQEMKIAVSGESLSRLLPFMWKSSINYFRSVSVNGLKLSPRM